jgi:thiol-disulfide isomerase/thioredoxin
MSIKTLSLTILLLLGIAAAACAPVAPTSSMGSAPTQAMMEVTPTDDMMGAMPTPDTMMGATPTDDMMGAMPTPDAMMGVTPTADMMGAMPTDSSMSSLGQKMDANPSWFKLALTDVRTGKNFTISDFAGKVVLLEDMATWCPNCLEQEKQVKVMLEKMGMVNDLVVIGLGVDLNEDGALLKSYADKNAFDWKFAVATPDVAKQISTLYGAQFLNPTPTPIMIIDRHGNVFLQDFGIKSADTLQKALEPHLAMN